jgi:hypothetical protein
MGTLDRVGQQWLGGIQSRGVGAVQDGLGASLQGGLRFLLSPLSYLRGPEAGNAAVARAGEDLRRGAKRLRELPGDVVEATASGAARGAPAASAVLTAGGGPLVYSEVAHAVRSAVPERVGSELRKPVDRAFAAGATAGPGASQGFGAWLENIVEWFQNLFSPGSPAPAT